MEENIRGISTASPLVTLTVLVIPTDAHPAGPIQAPNFRLSCLSIHSVPASDNTVVG